ncbi:MAG: MCE family protein [Acidobacteria bacterium]|nr:MCE family protein [Acidobacteriota bacterium]
MKRESKIGLFVCLAAVVIGYFIMRTEDDGTGGQFWKRQAVQRVEMQMEDASGLRVGTAVRVSGVRVGEVEDLKLKDGLAIAVLKIAADLELKDGATAHLQSQGVLGERFVALDLGEGSLLAGRTIKAQPSGASLDQVTDIIHQIGQELLVVTRSLKESAKTADGGNRLDVIAANLERLSTVLVEMMEQNKGHVNTTMSEFAALSQDLRVSIPPMVEEMTALVKDMRAFAHDNRENADASIEHIRSLTNQLDETMSSVKSVATKVDNGQGMIGKLINDDNTAAKLDTLLDEANASLKEVKNYLGQVNRIELDLGFYSDYLEKHEAFSGAFQLRISPSDNKYYMVEAYSRETDHLPFRTITTTETTYDADDNLISTTVIEEPDEEDRFGLGGQIAYRFGDVYVRGGLIEGSAGGGLDYLFLQDRAMLTVDAWQFNRPQDTSPHLKAGASYELGKGLRFRLGWDDLLESDLSSLYMGLGIRWKDDDLKPLLGTLGRAF